MSLPFKQVIGLGRNNSTLLQKLNIIKSPNIISCRHAYFPPEYQKPIADPKILHEMQESSELEQLKFIPILPAPVTTDCSLFRDELKERFIKYIMSGGEMKLSRDLMETTLEYIKRIQLKKYNEAETEEEKKEIELNPFVILHTAVTNCKPILSIMRVKRAATVYQVPIPLTEEKSLSLSIRWILDAGRDKGTRVSLPTKLSKELLDAFNNEGRVIKKKHDLHKLCEANRAYAHFRWN